MNRMVARAATLANSRANAQLGKVAAGLRRLGGDEERRERGPGAAAVTEARDRRAPAPPPHLHKLLSNPASSFSVTSFQLGRAVGSCAP